MDRWSLTQALAFKGRVIAMAAAAAFSLALWVGRTKLAAGGGGAISLIADSATVAFVLAIFMTALWAGRDLMEWVAGALGAAPVRNERDPTPTPRPARGPRARPRSDWANVGLDDDEGSQVALTPRPLPRGRAENMRLAALSIGLVLLVLVAIVLWPKPG